MNQIFLAFLTGLMTGGLSCFAVQGGLLAGILAEQKKEEQKKVTLMFLGSKFITHLLLGGLLGLLGSVLVITSKFQGVMQIVAGLFILLMALKISDIHPIFRNFTITPPKFIFKLLRKESRSAASFAPIVVGFLTILIPCGVTQAMMLLSVSSGSFLYGALILGSFVLGTTPIFFALGIASEKILSIKPLKVFAVLAMIYLAITSINSGQVLRGSVHTWQNYKLAITGSEPVGSGQVPNLQDGKQIVTIDVKSTSYKASTNTLKVGVPVKLILKTNNVFSCARSFTIPSLNISKLLPSTGTEIIEFTPTKLGKLTFTCSMGMYSGVFNIIE
ncbi:MAG: putative membrane protein [Candidatus Woesebacteria bacterium GW2011_GWA1_33_30]|uniref:Putative membrane protein n=1 Tax=Candidatus Woesebacteria bacterium GW2011_GWA2_33_28 TaxID=1618561 RepID=A0A0F9ZT86_9BACT|nr:MAG: putative membrane protein [Candidatus Woesebacteria bacterium GW2011_GWA2_33_28]KKP48425.1 MAG: putative membrane protein [Candidatus Woesebacteria bacterium GW2011_GWA1_33_30]KKP49532.1 MAG: putative membrane protein [Microgenomates group bacterium GW2011_GWC1_33_32]KKP52497.1 MAG: putative membrane protein [Candidatus Woesebacteria bacterium GW2011_GWB1_33_38]KKP58355.1 MAG: putative membrane protein [Microgenomates group bacterium GW2011_GWD1_33_9]